MHTSVVVVGVHKCLANLVFCFGGKKRDVNLGGYFLHVSQKKRSESYKIGRGRIFYVRGICSGRFLGGIQVGGNEKEGKKPRNRKEKRTKKVATSDYLFIFFGVFLFLVSSHRLSNYP